MDLSKQTPVLKKAGIISCFRKLCFYYVQRRESLGKLFYSEKCLS